MSKVIDIASVRKESHLSGQAKCLACGHEWVADSPVGVVYLQCPNCGTERGVYQFPFGVDAPYMKYTCTVNNCESQTLSVLRHEDGGYMIGCCRCGYLHSIDDVFI